MTREPLFDLVSYARRGPGQRDHLSPTQVTQISRTVGRSPEVMVKVLPKGAGSLAAVQKHMVYIGRKGDLDLETDDGQKLRGEEVGQDLVDDWDLDLDEHRRQSDLAASKGRLPPRLVHKAIFSMPAGTPPDKVLWAVRNFLREEFALKHRYVMALHTDEPHPHVHVVIKAVSEQGQRLHIRKATLREWRSEFARHLRAVGVPANATQRYVRGETTPRKSDGIYRAGLRGHSTHMRERTEAVTQEVLKGALRIEPGKTKLIETRKQVQRGWHSVGDMLASAGESELAGQVRRFVGQMPPPRTDNESLAAELLERGREPRIKERDFTR